MQIAFGKTKTFTIYSLYDVCLAMAKSDVPTFMLTQQVRCPGYRTLSIYCFQTFQIGVQISLDLSSFVLMNATPASNPAKSRHKMQGLELGQNNLLKCLSDEIINM